MESNNFTTGLKPIKEKHLQKNILFAIKELKQIFSDQEIEALEWNNCYVVIPLSIKINLPARGPIDGVDIRKIEPVILFLDKQQYPFKAPLVHSNRIDFPKDRLPHLNPRSKEMPASFCLYRGNLDSWFIEHSLKELLDKAKSWLEDAASGNLIREYDRFEGTRIDERYGYNVFDINEFISIVESYWKGNETTGGHVFLRYKILNSSMDPLIGFNKYSISFDHQVYGEILSENLEYATKINQILDKCTENISTQALVSQTRFQTFGILIWPAKNAISGKYFAGFPKNLSELVDLTIHFNIDLTEALQQFITNKLNIRVEIPITIAILRPQKLINYDSNIEFLTFLLKLPEGEVKNLATICKDIPVEILGHRNPLSVKKAREISGNPLDLDYGKLLFLGSGAIGSKIILHFARNGFVNCSIVDNDIISPHNLVRFGLIHESLGCNKAKAMKNTIKGIFYSDEKSVKVEAIEDNAINLFLKKSEFRFNEYNWVIDTTASPLILNLLTSVNVRNFPNYCRCEIANSGKIGLMYVEGEERKPRVDDLQVLVFDMAIDRYEVSKWLQLNRDERDTQLGSRLQEINIGISCSSETMRLSDELVSLHSAAFTTGFKKIIKQKRMKEGCIQLNVYDEDSDTPFSFRNIKIPQTIVLKCRNKPEWEVRIKSGIDTSLRELLDKSKPDETGGVLIGLINTNTRAIYITRAMKAPSDSISSPYAFVRGVSDIPDEIQQIHELTGSMLGYVGEWHTHPKGTPSLSGQDLLSIKKIKHNLDKVPMPTFIIIVTERGLYPYIFP